jgi:hypothetical protein
VNYHSGLFSQALFCEERGNAAVLGQSLPDSDLRNTVGKFLMVDACY